MAKITPTDLIGTVEAAQIIGVSPSTLCRWLATGIGPRAHKTPGGHWRLSRAAVIRYVQERTHGQW